MASPSPSPEPAQSPEYLFLPIQQTQPQPARHNFFLSHKFDLSPPLVAMVAVLFTAFLVVFYVRFLSRPLRSIYRRWNRYRHRRRRLALSSTDFEQEFGSMAASPSINHPGAAEYYYYYSSGASSANYYFSSPYGLGESVIKALPVTIFSSSKGKNIYRDCAVCLLDFEDDDTLRTLPICSHVFHMDCIDVWLRSHANCPLCRSLVASSPFLPMRAGRIRPNIDDLVFGSTFPANDDDASGHIEIDLGPSERDYRDEEEEEEERENRGFRLPPRDYRLKRSYSFGYERNLAVEDRTMMMMEASTPWRYHRHRCCQSIGGGGFWSKRWNSPFITGAGGCGGAGGGASSTSVPTSRTYSRVFSFRSYCRNTPTTRHSPFNLKRSPFFPLSESRPTTTTTAAPSRRTQSMSLTSPIAFFSNRMRCGDPEALLSPERLCNRE
ncbi:RING finger protein [Zostera marina]|uniref:RING-type E3 ubiquitin transferase n=1 Tax=Zostera marina TaxID=29655 RepID=A0A0K9P6F4_ZOSMR|nr:RING finger protein [Zostera marina]